MTRLADGLSLDPVVRPEFGLDTVRELRRMGRHRSLMSNLWSEVKRLIPLFHSAKTKIRNSTTVYTCIHGCICGSLYSYLEIHFSSSP